MGMSNAPVGLPNTTWGFLFARMANGLGLPELVDAPPAPEVGAELYLANGFSKAPELPEAVGVALAAPEEDVNTDGL